MEKLTLTQHPCTLLTSLRWFRLQNTANKVNHSALRASSCVTTHILLISLFSLLHSSSAFATAVAWNQTCPWNSNCDMRVRQWVVPPSVTCVCDVRIAIRPTSLSPTDGKEQVDGSMRSQNQPCQSSQTANIHTVTTTTATAAAARAEV
jgi:hypothetical protein